MDKHHLEGFMGKTGVYLDGHWLDPAPSQKVYNHSPDGFSWGYGGSGPAQLALAIMMKLLSSTDLALYYYQDFKWWLICNLPFNEEFDVTFDFDEFIDHAKEKHNG